MTNKYLNVVDQYDFLDNAVSLIGEDHDVSQLAVESYKTYPPYNSWVLHNVSPHRRQVTSKGAWLSSSKDNTIDVAGDTLTSVTAFEGFKDVEPQLYGLFKRSYHTIGNFIPWAEGGNLGGRSNKFGCTADHFYKKLIVCKDIFDGKVSYDTVSVKKRIIDGKMLGRGIACYSCIQYWIDEVWINNGKDWSDFITDNYLQDMTDDDLDPIPFIVGDDAGTMLTDRSQVKTSLIQAIKMIIKRGYRITHRGEINEGLLNDLYTKLEI